MTKTVTIDQAEYESLLEDRETLQDIAAFDRAMADYDADRMIPAEYVKRILDDENPMAVFRSRRDTTQADLARISGVNRVMIARIESGKRTGSVSTLRALSGALDVPIDDLV